MIYASVWNIKNDICSQWVCEILLEMHSHIIKIQFFDENTLTR